MHKVIIVYPDYNNYLRAENGNSIYKCKVKTCNDYSVTENDPNLCPTDRVTNVEYIIMYIQVEVLKT